MCLCYVQLFTQTLPTNLRKTTKMAVWSQRSSGYKVGVCLLVIAGLFYVSGYSSPVWGKMDYKTGNSYYSQSHGLWMVCAGYSGPYGDGSRTCTTMSNLGDWFKTVRALQSLCLIGVIVSFIYPAVANCCRSTMTHSLFLGILAAGSGALGFAGAIVYVVERNSRRMKLGWSFAIDVLGCFLILLSAVIIFISNYISKNTPTGTTTDTTSRTVYTPAAAPNQQGGTVIMQPMQTNPTAPVHSYQPIPPPSQYPQYHHYPQYPYAPPPGTVWGPPPSRSGTPPGLHYAWLPSGVWRCAEYASGSAIEN